MTMQQFLQLNEMEKVSAIMQYGRLMAQNIEGDTRIFLYHLEAFYVSASYSKPDDLLTEINCYPEVDHTVPLFRKTLISIHPAEREYNTPEI